MRLATRLRLVLLGLLLFPLCTQFLVTQPRALARRSRPPGGSPPHGPWGTNDGDFDNRNRTTVHAGGFALRIKASHLKDSRTDTLDDGTRITYTWDLNSMNSVLRRGVRHPTVPARRFHQFPLRAPRRGAGRRAHLHASPFLHRQLVSG